MYIQVKFVSFIPFCKLIIYLDENNDNKWRIVCDKEIQNESIVEFEQNINFEFFKYQILKVEMRTENVVSSESFSLSKLLL